MYRAKKTKNSFAFFTAELKRERKRDSVIEQELRGALEKEEFHLLYQPQIGAEGELHGVEALLRWNNERLGNVPPDRFIHIAEEIGLMPRIGHYVMERALRDIGAVQNRLGRTFCLSLNVSIRQFNEKNFIEKVSRQIEKHDVDRSLIVLEITESLFIEELESIVRQLATLRDLGLRISLDDFGTGYSSLNLLRRLPVDELKIDKSFIDTLLTDRASEAMVKAIVTLCQTLGLDIVAEGVEARNQYEWLKRQGCHIYQGYHFAKPLTPEELEAFILSLR
jgi:EAL domain-containing protein (putative c-di-GMP-specific phosphodiesterase class I)